MKPNYGGICIVMKSAIDVNRKQDFDCVARCLEVKGVTVPLQPAAFHQR
jgi:hypothetical protein